MEAFPPLIGILPAGQPLITAPTSQPTPTSFLYAIPNPPAKPFAHLAVFLLPGAALPDGAAAAIYLARQRPGEQHQRSLRPQPPPVDQAAFRFLGGVGPGKESAVFKLNGSGSSSSSSSSSGGSSNNAHSYASSSNNNMNSVVDNNGASNGSNINVNDNGAGEEIIIIGVSLEPAASVAERIQQQQQQQQQKQQQANTNGSSSGGHQQPSTQVLAQRIIQNAYNFLSSFSGQVGGGAGGEVEVEVVPLRAFQDWWRKFEGRVRSDPTFLEREQD